MKIFDSHAHYDDERYDDIRDELIKELEDNGVTHIVNCGASYKGLKDSLSLSEKYPLIYAAIGIHPSDALDYTEEVESEMKTLLKKEKVVAVGEIGLDYYWEENPSKEIQMEVLNKQYDLAREFNKPVILHVRDAYGDMMDFLRKNNDVKAVLHSFSGSPEIAEEAIKLGYYIGVGGVLTFKNAKKLPEIIKEIPLERILTETDAPYLTAVPHRGKTNRSDYISYVIERIAQIKEIPLDYAIDVLHKNSMEFFNIGN